MLKQIINHSYQSCAGLSIMCQSILFFFYHINVQLLKWTQKKQTSFHLHFLPNVTENKTNVTDSPELANIQNIIDFIEQGVILLDNNAVILSVNAYIEKLWGVKKNTLIHQTIDALIGVDNLTSFRSSWTKRNSPPQNIQVSVQKTNGEYFEVEMVLQKTKIGKSNYYMLNVTDISAQVATQKALDDKKAELDILIYKISHDLRGPLTSILGLINLANMPEINYEEVKQYIKLIEKSTHKLDATIKELIFFNEISARPTIYTQFPASLVIQRSLQEIVETEECKNVSFQILMDDEVDICSDITLVKNILCNLISNSVKYKKDYEHTCVVINLKKDLDKIKIEVSDNGQGIDKAIQDKVFNMFYRGNAKSEGSGLGLFLVKQSVEKLHGEIQLESTLHQGTCFKVILPMNSEPALSAHVA